MMVKAILRQWSIVYGLVVLVLVIGVSSFWPGEAATVVHAQLSCDDPPFDTSQIVQVWNKTDFCQHQDGVFDEIISGGVPRDGIPPIDNPRFESLDAASRWLQPQSPVIALEVDGIARAYPLAVLTRHEIANDVIGKVPVAVTFCPLCNSAIVFDRRVDGETLRFGVSGLLRNSDLIMWDDQTQSWWQQFTGTGIVGAYTGQQLTLLPSQVVGFGAFAEQYPAGEVLQGPRGDYGRNPYVGYDSSERPFLFQGQTDDRLFPTERVLAGVIGGEAIAYPFPVLADSIVINDTVGGEDVVAIWQPGATSALDQSSIDDSRDVGMAALFGRELDGQTLTFRVNESGAILDDQTDSTWNIFGTATAGELTGSQLQQQFAYPHFWFAWAAFQPDTAIYSSEAE
ncbi:MAG: hypothetical protein CL610_16030 [Anaerolineaceae bacterium]|nr:hypothetical protein [Anaerolineaceae bacterium]